MLKKGVLFIIRDWNPKVESQEIPRLTCKFALGVQNKAVQRLTEFLSREQANHSIYTLPTTICRDDSTNGHHQMVNIKIRLTVFFAAKGGESLYSQ